MYIYTYIYTHSRYGLPGGAGGVVQKGVVPLAGPDPVHELVNKIGEPAVKKWKELYTVAVEQTDSDVAAQANATDFDVAAQANATDLRYAREHEFFMRVGRRQRRRDTL